jgi:hypothetical protein
MSIGTSSLRTIGIELQKTYFQFERRDWNKTMKNDTSPMEVGI